MYYYNNINNYLKLGKLKTISGHIGTPYYNRQLIFIRHAL